MWSLQKIADVRGCTASRHLHPKLTPEAMLLEREAIANELIAEVARVHDATIHFSDLTFGIRTEGPGVLHRCWWRPTSQTAELVGGPADGDVRDVQVPGMHLQFTDGEVTHVYAIIGWQPDRRRWVYGVQARPA